MIEKIFPNEFGVFIVCALTFIVTATFRMQEFLSSERLEKWLVFFIQSA